jgi:hypothetical protein
VFFGWECSRTLVGVVEPPASITIAPVALAFLPLDALNGLMVELFKTATSWMYKVEP